MRSVFRQITNLSRLIPLQSRGAVGHPWKSVDARDILVAVGRVGKQLQTGNGARDIDRIKVAVDKLGVPAHLHRHIKVEDSWTLSLSSPLILTEDPVLARSGIGNESTVGNGGTESMHIIGLTEAD